MKKIAIVSNIPLTADNHKVVLESIFPNTSIEVFPVSETHGRRIHADAALVTAMDIVPYAQKYLTPGAAIVQCGYTLLKEQLEAIRRLSRGGPVTVVHENRRAAMTRRILLQRLGLAPDSLQVWYPGLGEERLTGPIVLFSSVPLPQGRQADYQVRGRMLNASSIFELALCLGIHDITSVPTFASYCRRVCTQFSPSIDDLSVSEFDTMVGNEAPQRGLVAFTQTLTIFYCDAYAASLMGRPPRELIGRRLFDAFPFLRSCEIHRGDEAREQLVVQEGKTYAVKLNQVVQTGRETGYLQISDYWAEEQRQGNLRRQVSDSRSKAKYTFRDIVGASAKLGECKKIAQRMAASSSNVLITGATGVGKELFAQSIHSASPRSRQPFVAVNCGAIVESLLESELFGYEKGAFTGANRNGKQGLFELAHKGTLFLDEIGEMPLHLQVRLLRVLQEKEVVRVGGDTVIPVDVRVIAATNKNLREEIDKGNFREDLYHRIGVVVVRVPALRERTEDIPGLVDHFVRAICAEYGLPPKPIEPKALRALQEKPWTGNIRELRNVIERLIILSDEKIAAADVECYC